MFRLGLAGGGRHLVPVLALVSLTLLTGRATAEKGAPAVVTAQQAERLKQRDRLDTDANKLLEQDKFPDAIAQLAEAAAIDRDVLGTSNFATFTASATCLSFPSSSNWR